MPAFADGADAFCLDMFKMCSFQFRFDSISTPRYVNAYSCKYICENLSYKNAASKMPGLESLFKNTSQDETKKGICILIKFETETGNRYQKS